MTELSQLTDTLQKLLRTVIREEVKAVVEEAALAEELMRDVDERIKDAVADIDANDIGGIEELIGSYIENNVKVSLEVD